MPKPIEVSSATALDLRAQLISQRESFDSDRQKGKQIAASERRQTKKPTVWARQNKGLAQRANNDKRIAEETGGPTLEASRAALQRKAKIYEEMRKRRRYNDSDDDDNQLIDFESRPFSDSEGDEEKSDGDDPWVDYEDEFGRSRTVRQSQLPRPRSPSPQLTSEPAYPVFSTSDYEARKREGSEEKETQRYDAEREIRTKGVGFYTFSKDEEERKAQMEELKRLREQTETARSHTMSVSARRKQALEKNAAKINARRLLLQQKTAASSSHQQKADIDDESISSFLSSIRNKK
ncbi:hypothetical protein INT44_001531 [Umbelopsis vinacea]|uniref:CCDC174 alpha/beta GRSR domain-containing protein n=1 Tax=Umbelopsis vinacea TaxID=44442 RepID=A0A8H7PQ43_9FUNG|nr:hypothetical protein INT44_001531 [Umbelopsis vinacea]